MIKLSHLVEMTYEDVKSALDAAGVQCRCWRFDGTAVRRRGPRPELPEIIGSYPTVNYGRLSEYRTSRLSLGETYAEEEGSLWIVVHKDIETGTGGVYTFVLADAAGIEVDVGEDKAAAQAAAAEPTPAPARASGESPIEFGDFDEIL